MTTAGGSRKGFNRIWMWRYCCLYESHLWNVFVGSLLCECSLGKVDAGGTAQFLQARTGKLRIRNWSDFFKVGGFLPGVKQIANVAALPGIVGHSVGLPDVHSGYGFAIGLISLRLVGIFMSCDAQEIWLHLTWMILKQWWALEVLDLTLIAG